MMALWYILYLVNYPTYFGIYKANFGQIFIVVNGQILDK